MVLRAFSKFIHLLNDSKECKVEFCGKTYPKEKTNTELCILPQNYVYFHKTRLIFHPSDEIYFPTILCQNILSLNYLLCPLLQQETFLLSKTKV